MFQKKIYFPVNLNLPSDFDVPWLEGQTFQKNDVVSSLDGFNLSLREVFGLWGKTFRNGNVFSFPKVCNLSKLTPFLTVLFEISLRDSLYRLVCRLELCMTSEPLSQSSTMMPMIISEIVAHLIQLSMSAIKGMETFFPLKFEQFYCNGYYRLNCSW